MRRIQVRSAVALAAAVVLLGACGSGSESTFTLPSVPIVPEPGLGSHGSPQELLLAEQFRPHLYFDSLERWRPVSVPAFLAERYPDGQGHGACAAGVDPSKEPCPDVSAVADLNNARVAFLDIHGGKADGADFYAPPNASCPTRQAPADCDGGPRSAIYYRRTSHDGRWYWDYWFFLRYNDYRGTLNHCFRICGDHEGDWEGVTVITSSEQRPHIQGAIYASHKDRVFVRAEALPRIGDHIKVFVANGTHASYPFRCTHSCIQYGGLPEEHHDGMQGWSDNSDRACLKYDCLRPLPEAKNGPKPFPRAVSWNGWHGLWGITCARGCSPFLQHHEASPNSPGDQARYLCPWIPTRDDLATVPRSQPSSKQPKSKEISSAKPDTDSCKQQAATANGAG